ncbi:MAG: cyclic nucleotide-binding domain-containing protein [Rhodobacteraceae bacterium]|nr:cyclic nucleotide-binding domain-containing protein [Paracoccaceae bacterium]
MTYIEILGWLASATTIVSYAMKTMLPLRITATLSSIFFLTYCLALGLWPMVAMELCLLPFNLWRLIEILVQRRRIANLRHAESPDFSVLKDYSQARTMAAGSTVFRRGDRPDQLYYIESGEVVLDEIGTRLGAGEIFGEIAFFTDAKARTATARCTADSRIHAIDERTFLRLYFQDPAFGMAIMKTITRRLIDGMARHPETYTALAADPA